MGTCHCISWQVLQQVCIRIPLLSVYADLWNRCCVWGSAFHDADTRLLINSVLRDCECQISISRVLIRNCFSEVVLVHSCEKIYEWASCIRHLICYVYHLWDVIRLRHFLVEQETKKINHVYQGDWSRVQWYCVGLHFLVKRA
jgi:hypothetical protein